MLELHIYTEGDQQRGLGHLSRCSAYAAAWRQLGGTVQWIVDGDTLAHQMLCHEQTDWCAWQEEPLISARPAAWALVDSYSASLPALQQMSQHYPRLGCLDDTNRLAYPNGWVIHSAPGTPLTVNGEATWRWGPTWHLLRPAFLHQPGRSNTVHEIANILLMMGGSDIRNLLPRVALLLRKQFPLATIHMVCSHTMPILPADGIRHENLDDRQMATLMQTCDIAISAAGQTTYELAAMGLPSILIGVAENQRRQLDAWSDSGLFFSAGWWDDIHLEENIEKWLQYIQNPTIRAEQTMRMQQHEISGAVSNWMSELFNISKLTQAFSVEQLTLMPFTMLNHQQKLDILAIRNNPLVAEQMLNTHHIREIEHIQFIEKQKTDTKNINYAVFDNNVIVGCVALQKINWDNRTAYFGIYRNPSEAQKGLGSKMMRALLMIAFDVAELSELKLEVKPDNERAIAFYTASGFLLEHGMTSPLSVMSLKKSR